MQPDICVIIPTIRNPECLRAYVRNAREHGFDTDRLFVLFVTEDECDTDAMAALLDELDIEGTVADEQTRQSWFAAHNIAAYSGLIPAHSHAQTSFGLLYMWANPAFEYGVFIDDDTRPPATEDFFGRHLANLGYDGSIRRLRSESGWVNVLHDSIDRHGLYPRGYPYGAMDGETTSDRTTVDTVVASQGLWTGVPDLDAVRILETGDVNGQSDVRLERGDYGPDFVAGTGQYLTVCSMNLAFRRCVIPAFYQLPMDDNRFGIGRFDDIWSGVFLKRACDLLDASIYNGRPLCHHEKAPRSTFGDLATEAAGLELNEHLWRFVDAVSGPDPTPQRVEQPLADGGSPDPTPTAFATVYRAMATQLRAADGSAYRNGAFLDELATSMDRWVDCLQELGGFEPEGLGGERI